MLHNIYIEGCHYRLRPITIDDAQFVIDVRNENAERVKYIHATSTDISLQIQWLEKYFNTPDDYYFVIENKLSGFPEGLISLYNIKNNKGESGRWVIKQDSLAAVESWYLLYRIAFETLCLDEVFCTVVTDNKPVVAFHKSVKQKIREIKPDFYSLNNNTYDAVEFYVDKEHFFNVIQPKLDKIIKSLEKIK